MIVARLLSVLVVLAAACGPVWAEDRQGRPLDGSLLSLSAGFLDAIQREDESEEFRLEYRYDADWYLKPWGGIFVTTTQSAYVHLGVYAEFFLTDNFYIAPAFAPGIYMKGEGKDLGHPLEFRSQLDLGWRFDSGWRVSVSINHLSNAGISDQNPGSETIALSIAFPLY